MSNIESIKLRIAKLEEEAALLRKVAVLEAEILTLRSNAAPTTEALTPLCNASFEVLTHVKSEAKDLKAAAADEDEASLSSQSYSSNTTSATGSTALSLSTTVSMRSETSRRHRVSFPVAYMGRLIGKNGEALRSIKKSTLASISVAEGCFIVNGPVRFAAAVEAEIRTIVSKIEAQDERARLLAESRAQAKAQGLHEAECQAKVGSKAKAQKAEARKLPDAEVQIGKVFSARVIRIIENGGYFIRFGDGERESTRDGFLECHLNLELGSVHIVRVTKLADGDKCAAFRRA